MPKVKIVGVEKLQKKLRKKRNHGGRKESSASQWSRDAGKSTEKCPY